MSYWFQIVRSTWFAPTTAYEVEFHAPGLSQCTRALLLAEQVEVEEGSLFGHAAGHPAAQDAAEHADVTAAVVAIS